MKENKSMVMLRFYDHNVGKELIVYGELEESKVYEFENNDDAWITLTDSQRTLIVPKEDVTRITILKEGEERFRRDGGEPTLKNQCGNRAII